MVSIQTRDGLQIRKKNLSYLELKQLEEIKEELQRANATIAENASEQKRLNALVLSLTNQLNDSLQLNREQALKIANLEASSRISKKH